MDRRMLIQAMLATGAAGGWPRWAMAERAVGAGKVRTLSDGNLVLPGSFILGGLPADDVAPILAEYGLSAEELTPPCNVTLYQDAERVVLFDCGAGFDFTPTAGDLPDSLEAMGLTTGDITHIVFTHGHPDHLWGLLDDFDDPAFPNATYLIGRTEWDYWTNPATVDTIGADRQAFAVGAARRLARIEDQIDFFDDGAEVLPGIVAVETPGHTPGHMAFEIGGADGMMVLGDAIANHHVAFARPDWETGNDQDPPAAAVTRVRLMDRLATDRRLISGFHLPGGGLGRVERVASGYRFVPADG
jgi:glyoxylase-like metal-dependent hydrolase (beta-lactamase superfamily II)